MIPLLFFCSLLLPNSCSFARRIKCYVLLAEGLTEIALSELQLKKEMGDVLWYLSNLASDFDFSLEDIARLNLAKLRSRKAKGTLSGSGSDR